MGRFKKTRQKVLKVAISWAKEVESWKLMDEESWLMSKVDWQGKLIEKESWLVSKVD